MKTRKLWKDRSGNLALTVGIIVMIVVLIAVAVVAVAFVTGTAKAPGWYDPGKDDENANPIFGYMDIGIQLRFDNSGAGNYVIYGIEPNTLTAQVAGAPPAAQMLKLDWFQAHNCDYDLEYRVTCPSVGYNAPIMTEHGQQNVGAAQNLLTPEIHNRGALALRDHGTYQITVTLLDGDGKIVSSATINASL